MGLVVMLPAVLARDYSGQGAPSSVALVLAPLEVVISMSHPVIKNIRATGCFPVRPRIARWNGMNV